MKAANQSLAYFQFHRSLGCQNQVEYCLGGIVKNGLSEEIFHEFMEPE